MKIIKFLITLFQRTGIEINAQGEHNSTGEPQTLSRKQIEQEEKSQKQEKNKAQREVREQVERFIYNSELSELVDYLKAGYPLSDYDMGKIGRDNPQWILADTKLLHSDKNVVQFQQHLAQECVELLFKLVIEKLRTFRTNRLGLDRANWALTEFKLGVDMLDKYHNLFNPEQENVIYKTYKEEIDTLKTWHTRIKDYRRENHTPPTQEFAKALTQIQNFMDKHYGALLKAERAEQLSKISEIYQDTKKAGDVADLQGALKTSAHKKIDSFQKSSLPQTAWDKIESIQTQGFELMRQQSQLSAHSAFEVKNLTQNVLLELIHEYTAISPEHKAHLKNEAGQSLDEILIDSLSHMERQLSGYSEEIAQTHFKEVKVAHQYLKAKM